MRPKEGGTQPDSDVAKVEDATKHTLLRTTSSSGVPNADSSKPRRWRQMAEQGLAALSTLHRSLRKTGDR